MAYKMKTPPIRIVLSVGGFNSLLEYLSMVEQDSNNEMNKKAFRLKEKLLKYTVPFETETNEEMVDIRFFVNEVIDVITILVNSTLITNVSADYYSVLCKVRESLKNSKE